MEPLIFPFPPILLLSRGTKTTEGETGKKKSFLSVFQRAKWIRGDPRPLVDVDVETATTTSGSLFCLGGGWSFFLLLRKCRKMRASVSHFCPEFLYIFSVFFLA